MAEKTVRASEKASANGVQRCILPGCGATFGLGERIYVCARCGGPLEIDVHPNAPSEDAARVAQNGLLLRRQWEARSGSWKARDRSGVWRYRELLPFDDSAPVVTLLEGNTPVYDAPRSAKYSGLLSLRLKHQGCNPTGSFKDTGMTAAITQAVLLGARTAVCASTGNTAASLAAYAARAGLQAAILVPHGQISAAKLAQSMDYGAVICEIDGNFDVCMRLIQELGDDPSIYVANSINPFRIEGQKTAAFELMEQSGWHAPDHIVVPGGNMGNSSALAKGFEELLGLGLIARLPVLHIIQAEGAAPLARLFASLDRDTMADGLHLPDKLEPVECPETLATAIKIGAPVSWRKALRAVLRSHGQIIAVSERQIADAKAMIGRDGIGCEPASATTVAGMRKLVAAGHILREESVVGILTGHVLKDPDYVSRYHGGKLFKDAAAEGTTARQPRAANAFRNVPERVAVSKAAILESLERRRQ
jgi:threonine synthase